MVNWIFIDFDNTLMETEKYAVPSLIARFNALYENKIGRPLTFEEFKIHFHGQARQSLCDNLSSYFHIHVDYQELYDARELRIMQHFKKIPQGITIAPYVIEVLTNFVSQGIKLALVTNNPLQRTFSAMRFASDGQGEILAKLFGPYYFEAGDVQKPKPDVYLHAMDQVGATPEHSFAVEDSPTGAKSSIEAGLRTFAFTGFADDPQNAQKKLMELGCLDSFSNWQDFPKLLDCFLNIVKNSSLRH